MDNRTLGQKFGDFIEKNNINNYRKTGNVRYYLPYKSDKKNIRIYIFTNVYEENKIVRIGFRAKLREDKNNIEDVRILLLDLNTKLTTGALALAKDSKSLEYAINYTVEDDEDIDMERYQKIIAFIMTMYFDLYDRKLIERENSMDE